MRLEMDRSAQRLRLEVLDSVCVEDPPLCPTLSSDVLKPGGMTPAALLAMKAKAFDDGLMAAVELAADRGAGRLGGKNDLLRRWLRASGQGRLWAALTLRGLPAEAPEPVAQAGRRLLESVALPPPLGFYTWSDELRGIFRRDRFLQQELADAEARELRGSLSGLEEDYRAHLRLAERLTNRLVEAPRPLTELDTAAQVALFPPSRAPETDLARRLLGREAIPPDFNLVDELVRQLEEGSVSLQPREGDGCYLHALWALEVLVRTQDAEEHDRVELGPLYRELLQDLFRSLLALTRETHVKQLELPALGCLASRPAVEIRPDLTVEPLVTFYQRRADSYRFLQEVLEESFGREALRSLHRLTPEGSVEESLDRELEAIRRLFEGCAEIARQELGLRPPAESATVREARDWCRNLRRDPDLARDPRMMVPLFYDLERRQYRVLAVVGYSFEGLEVSFARRPQVKVADDVEVEFKSDVETLTFPVALEFYTSDLMDRDAFRSLCDGHSTLGSLRAALGISEVEAWLEVLRSAVQADEILPGVDAGPEAG